MKGSIRSVAHAKKELVKVRSKLELQEIQKAKADRYIKKYKENINYLKSFIGNAKKSKVDE